MKLKLLALMAFSTLSMGCFGTMHTGEDAIQVWYDRPITVVRVSPPPVVHVHHPRPVVRHVHVRQTRRVARHVRHHRHDVRRGRHNRSNRATNQRNNTPRRVRRSRPRGR